MKHLEKKLGIICGITYVILGLFCILQFITFKTTAPHDHLLPWKHIMNILPITIGIVILLYYIDKRRTYCWQYLLSMLHVITGIVFFYFCYLYYQHYHITWQLILVFLGGVFFVGAGIHILYRLIHHKKII